MSVHCLLMARLKPVCTFVCTIRSRSTLNRRRPPQLSSSSMQPGSANAASSCEDAHWLMRTQVDWVGSWKAQCAWPTAAMEWCGEPPVPPLRTPAWGYARRRDSGHPVDVRYGHVWEGKNGLRQEFFWPRNEVPKYTLKTRGKNFTATARIVDMREQSDGTFPAVAQPTHGVDLPGCDGQLPTETGLGCIRGEWVGGVGGMVVRAAGAEKGGAGFRECVCVLQVPHREHAGVHGPADTEDDHEGLQSAVRGSDLARPRVRTHEDHQPPPASASDDPGAGVCGEGPPVDHRCPRHLE